MISFDNVTFKYPNTEDASLKNYSLHIKRGECVLLCGQSGCGKTTITRLINGLIPHYYEGELSGKITVAGSNIADSELYETAKTVGSVFQNPRSQFFCVDTTGEIAFGCENLGLAPETIKERVASAANEINVVDLLGRDIFNLSGGEKQKIACASVSAMSPEVFVLDEPTSNLEANSIEDLKSVIKSWKDAGKTIVIAEHRLYWLKEVCDRVIYMQDGEVKLDISMQELSTYSNEKLSSMGLRTLSLEDISISKTKPISNENIVLKDYQYTYKNCKSPALDIKDTTLPKGGIIAVVGHNGAGKSTLSKCLCGLASKFKGICTYDGKAQSKKQMLQNSYMVMQDVNHQLFCETVEEELRLGLDIKDEKEIESVMKTMSIDALRDRHPLSLSGGQKQRVAIASALLTGKELLVLDEPTSGLDLFHMEKTADLLTKISDKCTLFIVTHDIELIARCCNYIIQMEKGQIKDQFILDDKGKIKLKQFFIDNKRM